MRKPEKRKARAVYEAFRLAMNARPPRSAAEKMLDAIYREDNSEVVPIPSVYLMYEDWVKGKAKTLSPSTSAARKGMFSRFEKWAGKKGITDASDMNVGTARDFVKSLEGLSNKTLRNITQALSTIWDAVGQIKPGLFNPWKAAVPDSDGSSRAREAFTREQAEAVLEACRAAGHDWYGMSILSYETGLRYIDCACIEWESVDLDKRIIRLVQHKTRKPVVIPISQRLRDALDDMEGREGLLFPEHASKYRHRFPVAFSDILRNAGVKGNHTFHSWRHTFRTRLAAAGVSDETARRLGGWASPAMAAHYDHDPHLAEMRAAVDAISPRT